jgi:tripartite-type tricarboxylate transporter receptor subunit TctC
MFSLLLKLVVPFMFIGLCAMHSWAQSPYPTRTIKLVVPFPAGGGTDAVARIVTQKMSEDFNESIIVENKIGAGGSIATEYVAHAEPDGYTLLFTTSGHAIQPHLQKLNWDPIKDFAPISTLVKNPLVIAVRPDFKANTIKELVRMAKDNPGKFTYGSSGAGSALNLSAEYFKSMAKVDIVHIPYAGNAPMTLALLKGEVDLVFDSLTGPLPNIHAGKLRALAVTSLNRSFALPDTPTLDEAGIKGYDFWSWSGILAPAGTPKEILLKLNHQMVSSLENPGVRERLMNYGYTPMSSSTQEFQDTLKQDLEKYKKLIRDLNISVN